MALVDSFHSFEALNSDCSVSVKTCHGDLFPCGGGGGGWVEKEERRKQRELRELKEASGPGGHGRRAEKVEEDPK